MRVLQVLTYYRPHTSGLTIYVERLAGALARCGHRVTVLTSRYLPELPRHEQRDGVAIERVDVLARVSKGVIMPSFGLRATSLVRAHDVIHLHLPQFDAAGVALRGRLFSRPSLITYHCDLLLPAGLANRLVNRVVHLMNQIAARLTDRIVTYTQDYADHSAFLGRHRAKVEIISPPVELPRAAAGAAAELGRRVNPGRRRPVIGMATRFAAEKGVEVLLAALPPLLERFPEAMVLFAGQHRGVLGEAAYMARLEPTIASLEAAGRWRFLGTLGPPEMAAFYPNLDLLVVPSLNSTESFGLVQIEAMMHGVPVVASDLPGVRQPVAMTGMGTTAAVGDGAELARAIGQVLDHPEAYAGDPAAVARRFSPELTAAAYEELYGRLLGERSR
jgi:glycosyltransferase involved in cell wall biosynthesis